MERLTLFILGAFAAMAAAYALPLTAREAPPGNRQQEQAERAVQATAKAVFAAGCFWCVESNFDSVPGVIDTTSGYTGGKLDNPTYENHSGHVEAVQVTYDPARVSYRQLLDYYWRHVDLTDGRGQFCDRGSSYRPAIFVGNDTQKALAEQSKKQLEESGRFDKVAVRIEPLGKFFAAEDYHQNYSKKNPLRYRYYRAGCGRDARLEQLWGAEHRQP